MGRGSISWTACKSFALSFSSQHLITQIFTDWVLFLMPIQQSKHWRKTFSIT